VSGRDLESSLREEFTALRSTAGVHLLPRDVVLVSGPDASTYLQGQCSQEVAELGCGQSADALLLSPQGKIDAYLRITRTGEESFVLDTDGGFGEVVIARLERFRLRTKVELQPLDWVCAALRGPGAADAALRGPGAADAALRGPGAADAALRGPGAAEAARRGPGAADAARRGPGAADAALRGPGAADAALRGPGAADAALRGPGPAVVPPPELTIPVEWPGLTGVDLIGPAPSGGFGQWVGEVVPCGDAAWEAARIEGGLPVNGREVVEGSIAAELGLVDRTVSFTKGCFTGQELVARLDARGSNVARRLCGVVVEGPFGDGVGPFGAAVPVGATVTTDDGNHQVGTLTSVAWSPDLGATVALATVHRRVTPPQAVIVAWDDQQGNHTRPATARPLPLGK
jgi:folate-binding protein YgfZ